MRFKLRILNAFFWLAVWIGAAVWTQALGDWFIMAFQAVIPIMMWLFIHIALRNPEPET
jgi:hypothetical protein